MFKMSRTESKLDLEIARTQNVLRALEPDTDKYGTVLERLSKLYKLRAEDKRKPISTDTALTTAAQLVGILLVIHHEHVGVISTKALAFVPRTK